MKLTRPSTKMLIIVGPQGCGKSELLHEWSSRDCQVRRLNTEVETSGLSKLEAIELASNVHSEAFIDDVDAFIDINNIPRLVEALRKFERVTVTARNPSFFHYLEDGEAVESMYYLKNGSLIPYFEDPYLLTKLEVMGPGEVFSDTDWSYFYEVS